MAFSSTLPVWLAPGSKPNSDFIKNGFKPNDGPPPEWFNYQWNRTYLAIQELQQKAGEVKTVNNISPDTNGNISLGNDDFVTEEEFNAYKAEKVSDREIHGLRVTDGKLEFFDGTTWQKVKGDSYQIGNVTSLTATVGDGKITIKWSDPNDLTVTGSGGTVVTLAKWKGTKLLRKVGSFPVNDADGTLLVDNTVRNKYQSTGYVDTPLTNGVTYYYMLFPYNQDDLLTVDSSNRVSAAPKGLDDTTNAPGAKVLVAGTRNAGYFGTVPASSLITGDSLASAVGLSAGIDLNSNTDWLKFSYNNKILFAAKKPIRCKMTYLELDAVGVTNGDKKITINGVTYMVRLFRGSLTNPADDSQPDKGAINSEWNKLMLPISIHAPSNWANPEFVGTVESWGINFTDAELVAGNNTGDGARSLCQEYYKTNNNNYVIRGGGDVAYASYCPYNNTSTEIGWRPVLEVI